MKDLKINYIKNKNIIKKRLNEFSKNKDYFYELCFCILTPQSNAKKCYNAVLKLKEANFKNKNINPKEYIKGIGLKESSHYLRNIGYRNLAILDRHILKNLLEYKVINEIPKTLTKKKYYEIESRFKGFSRQINISMDELDLLFWSIETGEVFR